MKVIGIDPGVHTGIAVWDTCTMSFVDIDCLSIYRAIEVVASNAAEATEEAPLLVIVEDARLRRWFGNKGREALQGAGSIKRDCTIWEEVLQELKSERAWMDYLMRAPVVGATKWDAKRFAAITGWQGRTNEHSRDAAMIVYDYNPLIFK